MSTAGPPVIVDGHTHIFNRVYWKHNDLWQPQPFGFDFARAPKQTLRLLGVESGFDHEGDLDVLRAFYRLGVRAVQLATQACFNAFADAEIDGPSSGYPARMTRALSTPPTLTAGVLAASPQPALAVGPGVLLRPWEPADAPVFLSAYQDAETRRWHTRRPRTEAEVLEWFAAYRRDWAGERGGHWAVARDDGEVLGRIALRHFDFDDGVAGVGYWTLPAARGAGVATQAVRALSAWALEEIGFHRLELDHSTRNHASCRVAVKSGYVLEGTKRGSAVHDDGRHDMHLHARVKEG